MTLSLLALFRCQSHSPRCKPATQLPLWINWNCSLMLHSLHASGLVQFKRNHILCCSGSVDIFMLWHFLNCRGPFWWSCLGPYKPTGCPCLLFLVCKYLYQSFQFVFQCVLSQHQPIELLLFLWFISLKVSTDKLIHVYNPCTNPEVPLPLIFRTL